MTAAPAEFLADGRHWADVLGCDVRAHAPEIRRAADRRTKEAMTSLWGEALSKRLLEIGEATAIAVRLRGTPKRRHRGRVAEEIDE